MKNILLSILFFTLSVLAIAQNANDDYYTSSKPKLLVKDRISTSIMAGTSVSFSNNKNSYISTFIAPKINYQLTEKFRINIGLIHLTSYPNSFRVNNENVNSSGKNNNSTDLLFVGGEYRLNKKTIVSGAIMANMASINNKQNNYKAAAIGIDYKVSEHSTIGFRATVSQGNENNMFDSNHNSRNNYNFSNPNTFGNTFDVMNPLGTDAWNTSIR